MIAPWKEQLLCIYIYFDKSSHLSPNTYFTSFLKEWRHVIHDLKISITSKVMKKNKWEVLYHKKAFISP